MILRPSFSKRQGDKQNGFPESNRCSQTVSLKRLPIYEVIRSYGTCQFSVDPAGLEPTTPWLKARCSAC